MDHLVDLFFLSANKKNNKNKTSLRGNMNLNTLLKVSIIIFGIVAFFVVLLNLLVVIAIWKDPLKKLQNKFSYLLVHLFVVNILDGLIALPVLMYGMSSDPQVTPLVTDFIYMAMVFSTFSLSVDRYRAIQDPIHHRNNSSMKHVGFYVLGIWTCAILNFIGFYCFGKEFRMGFQIAAFTTMAITIVIMYIRIQKVFKHRNHQSDGDDIYLLSTPAMIEEHRKNEKAVLSTCKVIVTLQLISWMPTMILDYRRMMKPSLSSTQNVSAMCIINLFSTIGPTSDALVCIFKLKNFKESVKHLFSYFHRSTDLTL